MSEKIKKGQAERMFGMSSVELSERSAAMLAMPEIQDLMREIKNKYLETVPPANKLPI